MKGTPEVVLVVCPPWQTKMPPLGAAYLASYLDSKGVVVQVEDLNVALFNSCRRENKRLWDISMLNQYSPAGLGKIFVDSFRSELDAFLDRICLSKADIVGFSTTAASINVAVFLAHELKKRDPAKIAVIGGPGCFWDTGSVDPLRIVDMFVVGEGELPLYEIVSKHRKDKNLSALKSIQGTILNIDKSLYPCLPPNPAKNLNEIPYPKFIEFDLTQYSKASLYSPLPILTSRGCINKCRFCVDHTMNHPYRYRDPVGVLEEIKFLVTTYKQRDFEFNDLLCNGNLRQLEELCDLIAKEQLDITWTSYATVRNGMSRELCQKMKKAGCKFICYGFESGSDGVLKKMNKYYTSSDAAACLRNTSEAGIQVGINIILGYPGETEGEFYETCSFVKANKRFINMISNISTCVLMPDTELVRNLEIHGVYFKHSLQGRLKAIVTRKGLSCDFSSFYAPFGNSPKTRAHRLREFMRLVNKEGLNYSVINRVCAHDRGFDRFLQKLEARVETFGKNSLLLDFSEKGRVSLFSKGREITANVGVNTSFCTEKGWIDSSQASRRIHKKYNGVSVELEWKDTPLRQRWFFGYAKGGLLWKVETFSDRDCNIFQMKAGIMVSGVFSQYQSGDIAEKFSDDLCGDWREVVFKKASSVDIKGNTALPVLRFGCAGKTMPFLQIQRTPYASKAKMINYCLLKEPGSLKKTGDDFLLIGKKDCCQESLKIEIVKEKR